MNHIPGRKFKPSARAFNELDRVRRDSRRGSLDQSVNGLAGNDPCTWVWATAPGAMLYGAPVLLTPPGSSVTGDIETRFALDRQVVFTADNPSFNVSNVGYPNGLVGVTLDTAVAAGNLIRVAIGGIAWARWTGSDYSGVNGNAVGFLDTSDSNNTTHHRSFPLGHHLLLSRTAKGAFVFVNGNMQRGCNALADTAVTSTGGTVKILPATSSTPVSTWSLRVSNRSTRSTTNGNVLWIEPVSGSNDVQVIQEYCALAP